MKEECGAIIEIERLMSILEIPRIGQIHFWFRAKLLPESVLQKKPEIEEFKFFSRNEIPWHELAFTTTRVSLEHFFLNSTRIQRQIIE